MDFNLTDEQRAIVQTIRDVTQAEFKPRAQRYMDGTFPWENIHRLAELGVLGMAVPEEYGGMGLPVLDTALVLEEIAKGCYVTAMAVLGEVGTQTRIIATYAPEHFKQRLLPAVCSGHAILAICMTEPHAGTDVANYRTNVTISGDRVVLRGVKTLISRVDEAAAFVVFSRIDGRHGREGIGCVLIERGTPGLEVTARYHTMGGENLAEVQFNDCELPLENVVIREDGFRKLLSAFNTQRCLNPSISLGLAEGAFEESVKYLRSRSAFGKPIGDFQGMRWKLAEMYRDIEVGRGMLYRACASADPFPDPYMAALAKMYCNEMSNRVTSEAIQIHGGYGFTDEYPVSRLYRGARYGTLGGGTTETLKDLVGKKIIADFDDVHGFAALGTF
ncbi:acyl-CoA dehydrogenase family protein [Ancylobacter sp. MQZ15Z-1]|uniref:Acyl-CoA dehydrogenase family protein n=1 Tax=Ancylobacter mangrovi TaxID=2972472 RepID=A0A9X2T7W8_9HYPH|nr:acyl-CoA dehydrogenase family protein [Ancylobacter mangrovi]MCS0496538.1 acyl-CoA dehydrogenase family protein [Ancylobacter mangrovi]